MKIKKTLSITLILLLLSVCFVFSGCQGGETETTAEETTTTAQSVKINLSDYIVIRPEKMSSDALNKVISFRIDLNSKTKSDLKIKEDWFKGEITDEILNAKEILVGKTNRPMSSEYLTKAESETSFVIALTENKVIINSATDAGLISACDYFLTLINDEGVLEVPESNYLYVSEPIPAVYLVADNKSDYTIIYKDGLDTTFSTEADSKDKCDYEVDYVKELRTKILNATGVSVKLGTDWTKKGADTSANLEICIGDCDRPETREFLNSIAFDEYGYAVIGNKIVVTGWNLTTLKKACEAFSNFIIGAVNSTEKGKGTITLLNTTRYVAKESGYYADFPSFEAGTIKGCMDSGYGDMEVMYTDCTKDNFSDYCKKLESNGFTCWQTNDLDGNLSATYTSKAGMIHAYYVPTENAVRIITCPDGKYTLPKCKDKSEVAAYTKITETKITQMDLNYDAGNFGMCYIITLEDGSFIVIDGGGYGESYGDSAKLLNLLTSLNKRTDGKIVIAAWFVTHEHWDHVTNFLSTVTLNPDKFIIEGCYMNTPCEAECYNVNNPNYYIKSRLPVIQSKVEGGAPMIRVHTGMHFAIRNCEFDILYTEEDLYPDRNNYFNETSVIYRMEAAGQVIMWLGDNKNWGSETCVERYTSKIKADICQVSHHGVDGSSMALYNKISADILFWPAYSAKVHSFETNTSSSYWIAVDKALIKRYTYDRIIIADPTQTIVLPYKYGDTIIK